MSHRSLLSKLEKISTLIAPVDPIRIEVRRSTDRQNIYAVGAGKSHQLLAMESQLDYLRGLATRLDVSPPRTELLIGDRRSGTSWAGLVAVVSLAVAKVSRACVFSSPSGLKDTHELLCDILPAEWIDEDAESRGYYRLPHHVELHVVAYSRPKTWPEHCGVVMLNDYAYASEKTIEAVLQQGDVQIVTGNPPLNGEPGRGWILSERDRAKTEGMLFRFRAEQNQRLLGDTKQYERIVDVLAPEVKAFWEGTGL